MRVLRSLLSVVAIVGLITSSFVIVQPVHAQVFSGNTEIPFSNGITLIVEAGSSAVMTGTLTSVSFIIPAGGFVSLKYPGPNAGLLLNNVGEPSCRNFGGANVLTLNGPLSVTIVPDAGTLCTQGGLQVTSSGGLILSTLVPGGGSYAAGATIPLQWSTTTSLGVSRIRARLTTDGGSSYSIVADNEVNDGTASFIAPTIAGNVEAKVRIEAIAFDGTVLTYADSSPAFTLVGPAVVVPPAVVPTQPTTPIVAVNAFSPSSSIARAVSIDVDKGLVTASGTVFCTAGTLIRASSPAVYYCGADGKRYVFPNEKTYKTWYSDFSSVQVLTDAQLGAIQIGGNATYKPGVKMVKIQSDPRVYAVDNGGVLRHVTSEAIARSMYGDNWNTKIDDISDAFFVNYSIGLPITE